jgi:hypothetical protein
MAYTGKSWNTQEIAVLTFSLTQAEKSSDNIYLLWHILEIVGPTL